MALVEDELGRPLELVRPALLDNAVMCVTVKSPLFLSGSKYLGYPPTNRMAAPLGSFWETRRRVRVPAQPQVATLSTLNCVRAVLIVYPRAAMKRNMAL
jgi:hypothetical protein